VPEQRYLLTFGYPAGVRDEIGSGLDGHRDYFAKADLELAAWSLLKGRTPDVGLYHRDGTVGHAQVVESYIYRGPDWLIKAVDGTDVTVHEGDWLVGLLCDELAWSLYKSGQVTGTSIQGAGKRRRVAKGNE